MAISQASRELVFKRIASDLTSQLYNEAKWGRTYRSCKINVAKFGRKLLAAARAWQKAKVLYGRY